MTNEKNSTGIKKKKKKKSEANLELSRRIKELRIEKGYTSYEYFAFENGFHRAQYGRYENGEDIRFSTLVRLLDAFDVTLEEFFKGFKKGQSK